MQWMCTKCVVLVKVSGARLVLQLVRYVCSLHHPRSFFTGGSDATRDVVEAICGGDFQRTVGSAVDAHEMRGFVWHLR